MKPHALAEELKNIIAEVAGCKAAWRQERLTANELDIIKRRIRSLFHDATIEAINSEINARRRLQGIER